MTAAVNHAVEHTLEGQEDKIVADDIAADDIAAEVVVDIDIDLAEEHFAVDNAEVAKIADRTVVDIVAGADTIVDRTVVDGKVVDVNVMAEREVEEGKNIDWMVGDCAVVKTTAHYCH